MCRLDGEGGGPGQEATVCRTKEGAWGCTWVKRETAGLDRGIGHIEGDTGQEAGDDHESPEGEGHSEGTLGRPICGDKGGLDRILGMAASRVHQ